MEIVPQNSALQNVVDTSVPKTGAKLATAGELEDVTRNFEAILLRQFISEALKPLLHETLGSKVAGAGVYQQLASEVIADKLAEGGEFGFSSMLQMQLAQTSPDQEVEDASQ